MELAQPFDVHPTQIKQWRDHLLEGATGSISAFTTLLHYAHLSMLLKGIGFVDLDVILRGVLGSVAPVC